MDSKCSEDCFVAPVLALLIVGQAMLVGYAIYLYCWEENGVNNKKKEEEVDELEMQLLKEL